MNHIPDNTEDAKARLKAIAEKYGYQSVVDFLEEICHENSQQVPDNDQEISATWAKDAMALNKVLLEH